MKVRGEGAARLRSLLRCEGLVAVFLPRNNALLSSGRSRRLLRHQVGETAAKHATERKARWTSGSRLNVDNATLNLGSGDACGLVGNELGDRSSATDARRPIDTVSNRTGCETSENAERPGLKRRRIQRGASALGKGNFGRAMVLQLLRPSCHADVGSRGRRCSWLNGAPRRPTCGV